MEDQITKTHWADWKRQGSTIAIDVITPHKKAILTATSIRRNLLLSWIVEMVQVVCSPRPCWQMPAQNPFV